MPDPYWEAYGKELRAKKEQEGGIPCCSCGQKFHPEERDEVTCKSCRESRRKATPWRGKGSFGNRPVGFGRTPEQINETD